MQKWKLAGALVALIVGLTMIAWACAPQAPTPPSPVTVINTNTNTISGGNPSAAPSPGAGGAVASVGISEFGERCPAGVEPANAAARQVRIGCTSDVTCNPKDAAGKVIFNLAITGPAPDAFIQTGGGGFGRFAQDDTNPFNGTITGLAAGTVRLLCTVRGVQSEPWDMQVIP